MPSELMDQRHLSSLRAPAMGFSDEIHKPGQQKYVGFLRAESMPVRHGIEGLPSLFADKGLTSPSLEKSYSTSISSAEDFPSHQGLYFERQKAKLSHEYLAEAGRTSGFSMTSWDATEKDLHSQSNPLVQPASLNANMNKFDSTHENGLFASSLPDLFNSKLTLSANGTLFDHPTNKVGSLAEDDPFGSLEAKEIEAQTIGNLLPDDEDLLSGVIDELECIPQPSYWNDAEEDLFSSGGGMELEVDERLNDKKQSNLPNGVQNKGNWESNNSNVGEKSYSTDTSRTLFVRNVPSNIEDAELRLLFEQYGDIHTIYTACKNRGFVMISYYDLRSACSAMTALQNKLLRNRKLNVRYSITKDNLLDREPNQGALAVFNLDPSISTEDVHQIFGAYGEIRRICERQTYRLIEFYDVRSAEAAFGALNMRDVAGKQIEITASLPGISRQSMMQQWHYGLEKVEADGCHPQGSLLSNSPSRSVRTVSAEAVLSNRHSSGVNQGHRSISQPSVTSFAESAFEAYSCGMAPYLSSPAGVACAQNRHNQSGFGEHSHSLGHMNIGFDSMQNFHPHSLPECHEALINNISCSSPNSMSAMAINISRHVEGVESMHVPRVSSGSLNSMSFGCNERAFCALGNGSNSLHGHGHQYAWNNSNPNHQQLQSPVMWQDTSFVNNIPGHSPSQLQGLSRAQSHILNTMGPLHQHHVGSAPTLNHSIWDRRHVYSGDLAEASAFHPGSVESMGFSGSSLLHPMELGSAIFPHVHGNIIEPLISSPQVGLPSPQQKYHMFHGRNNVISMPSAFDGITDRVRSRRGDTGSNQVDNKRQYELDIDRIIRGEDNRTTLMIKNIPNKYTSKMLLAAIDENHRGTYDFIYLPIDFKNKCNVGYAFINMIEAQQIIPFYKTFNGKKWEKFNSEKVASLAYARIQGRTALIAHFQNSSLMNEDKRCRPILFHADGPNAGDQEPFPMGTNIRSRPGRSKAYSSEDNHRGSPSNSTDGEDTSNGMDSSGSKKE